MIIARHITNNAYPIHLNSYFYAGNAQTDDEKEDNTASKRPMLFESFARRSYEQRDGFSDDIRHKLESKDGRQLESSIIFIEAFKFMKQTIFNTFAKNNISINKENPIKDIQWILTVPAIWSDRAKDKMERWAQMAGLVDENTFNHLRIVYECDCASIACQYDAEDEKSFQPEERYIVIDAGAGKFCVIYHIECKDHNL